MKFDLHLHTNRYSPDSQIDPSELIQQAQRIGLDGIVITEHDRLWKEEELEALRAQSSGLLVFSGIEVSAQEGHFLVYGVYDSLAFPRGIGVTDLCDEVHKQGGAVVAAHPFRWGQPFDQILGRQSPQLDGMELMSNNMDAECRAQAQRVWREIGLAGTGSSDAHQLATIGCCYTEFDVPIRTSSDLVAAIRARRARACERTTGQAPIR